MPGTVLGTGDPTAIKADNTFSHFNAVFMLCTSRMCDKTNVNHKHEQSHFFEVKSARKGMK